MEQNIPAHLMNMQPSTELHPDAQAKFAEGGMVTARKTTSQRVR